MNILRISSTLVSSNLNYNLISGSDSLHILIGSHFFFLNFRFYQFYVKKLNSFFLKHQILDCNCISRILKTKMLIKCMSKKNKKEKQYKRIHSLLHRLFNSLAAHGSKYQISISVFWVNCKNNAPGNNNIKQTIETHKISRFKVMKPEVASRNAISQYLVHTSPIK